MKNKIICIFLSTIFANCAFANNIKITNNKGEEVQLETSYNVTQLTDLTDLTIASGIGDINYLKSAIAKDSKIITKINDLYPLTIIGFGAKNIETLSFVKENDKNLFDRKKTF